MENQDKIYEQFKHAADKAENKSFDRMEAVWNRVEDKLDKRKKRRAVYWKYAGVAAMLLVFIGLGSQFFKNTTEPTIAPQPTPETQVVTIDTNKVNEVVAPKGVDALKNSETVVSHETNKTESDSIPFSSASKRAKIWKSVSDKGKFRVKGEIIKTDDSVYYINGARFTTSKKINDPEYYFYTDKIKLVPGEKKAEATVASSEPANTGVPTGDVIINPSNSYRNTAIAEGDVTITKDKYAKIPPSIIKTESSDTLLNGRIQYRQLPGQINQNQIVKRDISPVKDRHSLVPSAIQAVSTEAIEDRANASIVQSLQGQVAGLNIATGSGQPGSDSTIILRGVGSLNGNTEPLFIIDGKPVDEATFRNLNQNDIAEFKVIKDAAATSIYGNRGANGVIVINTVQGQIMGMPIKKTELSEAEKNNLINNLNTIRGNQEPLFVVDGIPMDSESFRKLNANDFETVRVLKDASATSLYGNRGSNGVIVIKTKQGSYQYEEPENEKIGIDEEDYKSFEENKFENPAKAPLSTFSIDVDNASYTNIRRFINNGQIVPKDAVRVEEMINFFKYSYPQPVGKEPFSINTEYSDAPWNPNHKLLKIGLKGKEIPTAQLPASNFVFLIDVSGSMDEPNKLPLLKESMKLLVKQMRNTDRIAIVVYAGAAGLVLPSTNGSEKETIIAALDNLQAGGSTAGGAGIELAYKTAVENFIKDGNNRVVLATDGDFNVGASSNSDMETLIEEKRKSGVFLTCLGYGMGNYKDSKMEILADKGNGNYAYIDNMQEADRFLQKEFKGSMFAIAKDVKIQVEFNPKHVQSYRLIGYENRKLRDEDFANDAIDAGELGSGHTVTALYEIIPTGVHSDFYIPESDLKYTKPAEGTGNYNDELATIKLRHKKPDGDKSTETVQVVPNQTVPLYQASGDFKFAAAVAWFGLKLRDSKLVKDKSTEAIIKLAKEGLLNDTDGYRAEFVRLVNRIE